ncbi:MAG: hypothetical protein JSV20_10350 [Candidatus Bathyarchaeota archaeon]|nr:MAG: hypothetical protein JSV20_10350 [Candidatus Bathyarchaeota archaeon]
MFEHIFESQSIGFLTFHSIDESYVGAVLVTDFKGVPMEFRCTHPIKPDAIQLSLYGATFLSHVGVELCGKPLIKSVKNKPKFIIVNHTYLLNLDNYLPYPVILVKRTEHQGKNAFDSGSEYQIKSIKPHDDQADTFEIISRRETIDKSQEFIKKLCTEVDILEPFERIKKAIEIITRKNARLN